MRDDVITVGAIAIVAMCVATAAHEAAGHGSACLALGGHITLLTSVYFRCAVESRLVSPAGPLGNIVAGLIGWATMRLVPPSWPRARLFALLLAGFSFFWAFGYLVSSLATGNGDYAIAGRDFLGHSYAQWRIGGIAAGVLFYLLFSRAFRAASAELFGLRTTNLLRISWLTATSAAVAAAALYAPDRGGAMTQAALEIGAASIPLMIPRRYSGAGHAPAIARSTAWVFAAMLVFAVFALTLGAGYRP